MAMTVKVLVLLATVAVSAGGAPLNVRLNGTAQSSGLEISFVVDSQPVPDQVAPAFFVLENIPATITFGGQQFTDTGSVGFYVEDADNTGLFDFFGSSFLANATGPQVFTGSTAAPTILPGTYTATSATLVVLPDTVLSVDEAVVTIEPASTSTIPEPSTLATSGLLAMAILASSRLRARQ